MVLCLFYIGISDLFDRLMLDVSNLFVQLMLVISSQKPVYLPQNKNKFSPKFMATKKSVKKVEITDENVLDLKAKDRNPGFTIHRIQDAEQGRIDVPIERFSRSDHHLEPAAGTHHIQTDASEPTTATTSTELMDRPARSMKYDPEELQQRMESFAEKLERAVIKVSPPDAPNETASAFGMSADPKELIKVKFDKFVTLVASRDFLSVMEKNRNEDIILSSNLLTDLAGAVEEKTEKKTPVIFLVGLAIGVIVTYLLINK